MPLGSGLNFRLRSFVASPRTTLAQSGARYVLTAPFARGDKYKNFKSATSEGLTFTDVSYKRIDAGFDSRCSFVAVAYNPAIASAVPTMSEIFTRPTWAEISRTALQHNYATVRDYVAPGATVCAVVKANAYGHGALECALAFQAEGANWFGVST